MNNTLCIIACGLGTRMSAFTADNYIPKLLVNVGGKTVLSKIIDGYGNAFNRIIIALPSHMHIDMVDQYLQQNHIDCYDKFVFVEHTLQDGSANAVIDALRVIGKDVDTDAIMVHWCDVFAPQLSAEELESAFASISNDDMLSFTINDMQNRHLCLDCLSGNVVSYQQMQKLVHNFMYMKSNVQSIVGLYAFKRSAKFFDKLSAMHFDCNEDFARIWRDLQCKLTYHQIAGIECYGDAEAYTDACAQHAPEKLARYFNTIDIGTDVVTKTAHGERGLRLIKNEMNWYSLCDKFNIPALPRIIESTDDTIRMTKIDGMVVKDYIDIHDPKFACTPTAEGLIRLFERAIKPLHDIRDIGLGIQEPSAAVKEATMIQEYVDTTVQRRTEVSELLDRITHYNGVQLPNFDKLMHDTAEVVHITAENTPFVLLHGDPHTGNVMIDEDGTKLSFIDPRGYFGSNPKLVVGDIDYDISKFVFGLTGNTAFARMPYHVLKAIEMSDSGIKIIATVPGYDLDKLHLTARQKWLVGLQWLKFAAWLKNNPAEAIITYCHGLVMTRKWLDVYMQELKLV